MVQVISDLEKPNHHFVSASDSPIRMLVKHFSFDETHSTIGAF